MGATANSTTLHSTYSGLNPIDAAAAYETLREAKQIFERMNVVFFLRQGTCLGIVREGNLISWDDDLDLGSILGLHGLSESSIEPVVTAFRDNGYFAEIDISDQYINAAMIKSSVRIDWTCFRIIGGEVFHYPGLRFPLRLFTELKEIDFIDENFLLPNPPEEYLSIKYGPSWMTPKKGEWTKDVVGMIPQGSYPGRGSKLRHLLARNILRWRVGRLRVLDAADNPVSGADVTVVGLDRSKTNKQGYAPMYLPNDDFYAVVINHGSHEEVLYQEKMHRGATYVYRPDPSWASGRYGILAQE